MPNVLWQNDIGALAKCDDGKLRLSADCPCKYLCTSFHCITGWGTRDDDTYTSAIRIRYRLRIEPPIGILCTPDYWVYGGFVVYAGATTSPQSCEIAGQPLTKGSLSLAKVSGSEDEVDIILDIYAGDDTTEIGWVATVAVAFDFSPCTVSDPSALTGWNFVCDSIEATTNGSTVPSGSYFAELRRPVDCVLGTGDPETILASTINCSDCIPIYATPVDEQDVAPGATRLIASIPADTSRRKLYAYGHADDALRVVIDGNTVYYDYDPNSPCDQHSYAYSYLCNIPAGKAASVYVVNTCGLPATTPKTDISWDGYFVVCKKDAFNNVPEEFE